MRADEGPPRAEARIVDERLTVQGDPPGPVVERGGVPRRAEERIVAEVETRGGPPRPGIRFSPMDDYDELKTVPEGVEPEVGEDQQEAPEAEEEECQEEE